MERWANCAAKELTTLSTTLPPRKKLTTVYFGGGTPSLLSCENWQVVLKAMESLPRDDTCEFTVEANPESLTLEKLRLWRAYGVNRISLGVQSLNDMELKTLARPHTASDALQALDMCIKQEVRVSADLMFALPGQTLRSWHNSLRTLVHAGIEHISIYQLTIEPESYWGRHTPQGLPDGYQMYRWAQYYLCRRGFCQYEIASFATYGQESRHNLAYWRRSDVYAVGPGAWGFVNGTRFAKIRDFSTWATAVEQGIDTLDYLENLRGAREASEAAVLALRTSEGIDFRAFAERYGNGYLSQIIARLRELPSQFLYWKGDGVALSARGMRVGNAIWSELIDLEDEAEHE